MSIRKYLATVAVLFSGSAIAEPMSFICEGQTATHKVLFRGSFDPEFQYVDRVIAARESKSDDSKMQFIIFLPNEVKYDKGVFGSTMISSDFNAKKELLIYLPTDGLMSKVYFWFDNANSYGGPSGVFNRMSAAKPAKCKVEKLSTAAYENLKVCHRYFTGCIKFRQIVGRLPTTNDLSHLKQFDFDDPKYENEVRM